MSDQPNAAPLHENLHELARLLRESRHLDPGAQRELARLVDELGSALPPPDPASPEAANLSETVAHLTEALSRPHDQGLLASARSRLEDAAIRTEEEVPLATGILRRIIEALADLGI